MANSGRGVNCKGRSKKPLSPFLPVPRALLASKAFRELKRPGSATILLALAYNGQRKGNWKSEGEIAFGVREGEHWGIGRTATADCLKELIEAGFIEQVQPGCFTSKRLVATYRLRWWEICEPAKPQPVVGSAKRAAG